MMLKNDPRIIDKLIDDVIKLDNIEYLIVITSKQDDVKAPIKGTELGALERYEVLPKAIRADANNVMNAIVEAMLALTDINGKKHSVKKLTEYLENELKQTQPNLTFIEYVLTKGIAVTKDQDVNNLLKIYRDNQNQNQNKKTVLELINFLIKENRENDNKFFQFAYLLKHLNKEEISTLIQQKNFIEGILILGLSSNHSDVIAQALKGSQAVKDNAALLQKLLNDLLTQTAPNYNAIKALITLGMKIENKDTFYNFIEKNLKDLATNQTLVAIFDVFLKDTANYDKKGFCRI